MYLYIQSYKGWFVPIITHWLEALHNIKLQQGSSTMKKLKSELIVVNIHCVSYLMMSL